jgi:hypothetical protein
LVTSRPSASIFALSSTSSWLLIDSTYILFRKWRHVSLSQSHHCKTNDVFSTAIRIWEWIVKYTQQTEI